MMENEKKGGYEDVPRTFVIFGPIASRRVTGPDPLVAPTLARQPRFGGRIPDLIDPPHLTLFIASIRTVNLLTIERVWVLSNGAPPSHLTTPGNPSFFNHHPLAPFSPTMASLRKLSRALISHSCRRVVLGLVPIIFPVSFPKLP